MTSPVLFIRVDDRLHRNVRVLAAAQGVSMERAVKDVLEAFFESAEGRPLAAIPVPFETTGDEHGHRVGG